MEQEIDLRLDLVLYIKDLDLDIQNFDQKIHLLTLMKLKLGFLLFINLSRRFEMYLVAFCTQIFYLRRIRKGDMR